MQRTAKHVRGVLRAVLVCGMAVQILLGLAWLIKNRGGLQSFQESMVLLTGEGRETGLYSGVLYRGLAGLLSSHLWILYGIQLAAALTAGYGLTVSILHRGNRLLGILGALALTTIPQALQCHLAVLPWSLGTSLIAGETALWLRQYRRYHERQAMVSASADEGQTFIAWRSRKCAETEGSSADKEQAPEAGEVREIRTLLLMLAGWLLLLLILPVYAWFILPLVMAALWQVRKGKGKKGVPAWGLTVLLLCLGTLGVNCGFRPADWNRQLAADALSRWGWPYFQDNYEVIPPPLHEDIGLVTAREVSAYADGVERVLIPKLEEQYGAEETTALLWELTGICLRENLKKDVKNVIWDLAAYHAAPPILEMQLRGRAYESFSGINYEQMKNRAPVLTRYYVTYGGRWWWMMPALAAAIWLCMRLFYGKRFGTPVAAGSSGLGLPPAQKGLRSRLRDFVRRWLPVGIGVEMMILCFVFGGSGIMDYKKAVWVTILWYLPALSRLGKEERVEKWQQ